MTRAPLNHLTPAEREAVRELAAAIRNSVNTLGPECTTLLLGMVALDLAEPIKSKTDAAVRATRPAPRTRRRPAA
jgi:hypothetical protein